MNTYETTATITDSGQISLRGVPFAPGTQVEVAIRLMPSAESASSVSNGATLAAARARMQELFGSVKGFRMGPKIPREELYDRRGVR
jgi:hypothetical protein